MKTQSRLNQIIVTALATCLIGQVETINAAPFTAGNIAVLQADASASNTTASVIELSPATAGQTPTNSIVIDGVTAPNSLRFSGSATSTGYLTNTADGSLVCFTGGNTTTSGTTNINTILPRGVGAIDASGAFSLATTYTGTSGQQTRSATSLNNTNWFIADQAGIYTNSATSASPSGNVRGIKSFGSTVYVGQSSSTVTVIQVSTVSAPSGGTITGLPGLTNMASLQDFYLISSGDNGSTYDVLYVLGATSNTVGAISKYSLVSGSWVANGTSATTFGGFGLAAKDSGAGAELFVSTGQGALTANNVLKITDTAGYNATINVIPANNVTLYTAPTGKIVKGVAFAPISVASTTDLIVSNISAPATADTAANFNYTITVNNVGTLSATGVAANFTIPAGLSFVSASGTNGFTGTNNAGTVEFTGGSINGISSATLTVTVNTNTAATYTAAIGSVTVDPSSTITESNETNNSNTVAASTIVSMPNTPPSFTTHPANVSIANGATATLTSVVVGSPAPTLQWYLGTSGDTANPIGAATNASFTTPSLITTTSYWVRATNTNGTADSSTAVVTVAPSTNADLSALSLTPGVLNGFSAATTSYTAYLANSTTSLTVTPTAANAGATITVNGVATNSGAASAAINANVGANTITIVVTAQDGVTTKTYTLNTFRSAADLTAGSIAFTAFNADGSDDLAFVALTSIPADSVIFFSDNEWNGQSIGAGGAFNDLNESEMVWVAPAGGIAAGTVVTINNISAATTTSAGTVAFSNAANRGYSTGAEAVYAFQGSTHTPNVFLTQISTDATASLVGTGLTVGTNAIALAAGSDGAAYTAPRNNQATIAAYLAPLNTIANWNDVGNSGDGTTLLPFDVNSFVVGSAGSVSIAAASIAEGDTGTVTLSLPVTRTETATAFTIDYAVTGGTATAGTDFATLSAGTLTFTNGGVDSQNIEITVNGDTMVESNETVTITLSNLVVTSGLINIGTASASGTITNDDSVALAYPPTNALTSTVKGFIALGGAEIPAFDPVSKRGFTSSGTGVQVVDLTNPAAPVFISTITPASLGVGGLASNDISSIAVRKGTGGNPSILAAAVINNPKTDAGHVVFLNAATGALVGSAVVGVVPDHIAWTPDGTKLLVCNEGELDGSSATIPDAALGTVSIVSVNTSGVPTTTATANFTSFDAPATIASLRAAGVRFFGASAVPSTDFEPEYLAISPDGTQAMVTLQEANAVATLDIATATFTSVVPLGQKDFSAGRHDFSDRDGAGATQLVNPAVGAPVFGLYMPDAIASYSTAGQTYYVTANEGDDRNDFINPDESTSVSDAGYTLDPSVFPNATALKTNASLGRLTVSNYTGLRGDTDNDGDVDQILSYGGRSFSIHDAAGNRVFDSGDMIEMIVASQHLSNFDDGRSDNKGPEPEGVAVATIGARSYAFVGLERSRMALVFDVTNPAAVTYTTALKRTGDLNPEGLVVVSEADSPTGRPLVLMTSEVSNTLSIFELTPATDFTMQLLHIADAEAGLLASQTAPNLAALVDAFDGTYANTLILAGGDNYIPGPFAAAGTDAAVAATHNKGNNPFAADIEIHNRLGVEASTIGNHEFDFGTNAFSDAINDTSFPYLSANLDFSGDSAFAIAATTTPPAPAFNRYVETVGVGGLEEASTLAKRIVPSCVVTKGAQKIGLVGATTQIVRGISSTGNVLVKGNPVGDDMVQLASVLQPVIDDLKSQGVNKIILMAHLQQIANELTLAPLLSDVDIILAAGSNTRLGDTNDVAVAFTGHAGNFAGNYPLYTAGADGKPCVVVNTDNEFTYLGRLVADFDADGVLIVPNLLANTAINGAYAATASNVAAAWGVPEVNLPATAFASGTKGALVKQITDAVQGVITTKDGDVRGFTNVYLEGERNFVRNQETNLGNISADSMVTVGQSALPSATHVAALKNGGGIRAAIGAVEVGSGAKLPPLANPAAGKPAGAVSLLDIENSMRFNNGLMLCDTTPAGLKAILEHGVASLGNQGRFPQIGGIRFSYNPSATAGSRIQSIVTIDDSGAITGRVVSGGVVLSTAPATITLVTLNFLANGGDGYPFKANADNFRFLLTTGGLSAPIDEALSFTAAGVVPVNILGEQSALSSHLQARYATAAAAYNLAETPPANDTRIQSTAVRTDTVLTGPATFAAWLATNGYTSAGMVGDSDLDGTPDILEYFFNQNPNDGSDVGNLPVLTQNGPDLELQFTVNSTSVYSGVLRVSDELAIWRDAVEGTDYEVISVITSGGETTYRYRILASGSVPKFFQLELVDAP